MSHSRRILVVEDDAGIRDLIRTRLNAAGYDTHIAKDGVEAMNRIGELRPNGVVLDINMPNMDGFSVLQAMRDSPSRRPCAPVLVLTARHDAADVRRAVSLGAKDYLTKPFSDSQLLARVARLLRAPIAAPPKLEQIII
jgi:DNA-binding response OmpR family regulator